MSVLTVKGSTTRRVMTAEMGMIQKVDILVDIPRHPRMSHWRDLRITALTISVAGKVAKKVNKLRICAVSRNNNPCKLLIKRDAGGRN